MEERWKEVRGYEGMYMVSDQGRMRSCDRVSADITGKTKKYTGVVLKQAHNKSGHAYVHLKKGGCYEKKYVHRAVAEAFVVNDRPDSYNEVNHLDSNPMNNVYTNLEWTDHYGNMHHALEKGRFNRTPEWVGNLRKTNEITGKAVIGECVKTGKVVRYLCLNDCAADGFEPSSVCWCCKNKRKTHAGYRWRYATQDEKIQMLLQVRPKEEIESLMEMWEERSK